MSGLPVFRYHPDPLATGSVVASDSACLCCGAARGYLYEGPFYAVDDVDAICPWCIADGSAAERYSGEFTDAASIGEDDDLGEDIIDTVSQRTPGFAGWQQERWLSHCGDAAAFLGKEEAGSSTTYLFRCLHCGALDSYSDCN